MLAGFLNSSPVAANGDRIFLDCPCEIESDGSTLSITAGVRSFRSIDSGVLTLRTEAPGHVWDVSIADSLATGATLETTTYDTIARQANGAGVVDLELVLYEQVNDRLVERDRVRMETRVDLSGAFQVSERDYLTDNDGDGVGDINERHEGTDPLDAESTPGPSTIDVLAFFSQAFSQYFDGDATTRIQHLVALTNEIYRNSDVQMQLRLVGTDRESPGSDLDNRNLQLKADRHGADLVVLFRAPAPRAFGGIICGRASTGGVGTRGHIDSEQGRHNYSIVYAGCGARTLAHELGHVMGLGHSFWQKNVGTWRWSRGHAVDHDFGTIMTYGPENGPGQGLDVFSNPQLICIGWLEEEKPCGIEGAEVNGADAVTSLNAVRFQIARFRDGLPDADKDGFVDPVDLFPDDPGDWWDADDDGVGDNADSDDDNDGVLDGDDAFPFDASESADTDDDGIGDNADAFPSDPGETSDADGDGVGDNTDVFPGDPLESADSDGDGVGDNGDLWPQNPDESADADGDGIGDNADPDADNDGIGDDVDAHPLDATKSDLASFLFTGEFPGDQAGEILSRAGGGDSPSFLIGVPLHDGGGLENAGAVYLVSASDLATLDAADGLADRVIGLEHVVTGANSWKFVGEVAGDQAGRSLLSSGDMDGDGRTDLFIGAPNHGNYEGAAYFVSGADFAAADAADGVADRTIRLGQIASQSSSWKFVGEAHNEQAGVSLASVPDIDGDGVAEYLVSAWEHDPGERSGAGATYFLSSGDLPSADTADGASDGVIDLGRTAGQPGSWKLIGESPGDRVGFPMAAPGDVDGDGNVEIAINSRYRRADQGRYIGAVYLISIADLAGADAADGQADRVVDLSYIAEQPNSWKLHNGFSNGWTRRPLSIAYEGVGSTTWLTLAYNVLSSAVLASTDAADGTEDGVVDLDRLAGPPTSFKMRTHPIALVGDTDGDGGENFLATGISGGIRLAYLFSLLNLADAEAYPGGVAGAVFGDELRYTPGVRTIFGAWPFAQVQATTAGDTDSDGLSDILLGDPGPAVANRRGAVYLLPGADLPALDRVDKLMDDRLLLGNVAGDTDRDGVLNSLDRDDDGDGIPDGADVFHLDPGEWADSDEDGVGDNADAFPNDGRERFDTDGDGLGDRYADDDDDGDGIADDQDAYPFDTDNDGTENRDDDDDDGDGIPDIEDALPIDPSESSDTDNDGLGNNADTDDDNDGVADEEDTFPLDPGESLDTDADGVGDNADAFPSDPNESRDLDGDGVGDNADPDDDNDGILDADDRFPHDPGASTDTDGDGVADSRDAFVNDAGESADTDGDGIGDNTDTDDDNDGVEDAADLFPRDASRWDLMSFRLDLGVPGGAFPRLDIGVAGDLDGEGNPEMLIAAPDIDVDKVVHVVDPGELADADGADGARDGFVHMRHVLAGMNSWKLLGEEGYTTGTILSSFGDLDEDGLGEFYVGAGASYSAGYVISGADLLAADAADTVADGVIDLGHVASQPGSWKLQGYRWGGNVLATVPTDLSGDGLAAFAVGQPESRGIDSTGLVQVISTRALPVIDALDGDVDRELTLSHSEGHELWRLVGEAAGDRAGASVAVTDFNRDGRPDFVIGAPRHDAPQQDGGAVYLLDSADLASADLADGSADLRIELARIADEPGSWKLVVDVANGRLGSAIATGDLDGDGRSDLILPSLDTAGLPLFIMLSGLPDNLAAMDGADGVVDGVIDLSSNRSAKFLRSTLPFSSSSSNFDVTDFDGDGREDLVFALRNPRSPLVGYLITASELFSDNENGTGRVLDVEDVFAHGGAYQLHAPEAQSREVFVAIAAAGDIDADGLGDILLAALPTAATGLTRAGGVAYVIIAADLPHLDAADGRMDGRIFLSNVGRGMNESPGGRQNEMDTSGAVSGDNCFVGLLLRPGESCTYPGTDDAFTVNVRGRGSFLTFLAGIRIRINNETINGREYDFRASHQGDGVWRIDRVAGSTEPPSPVDSDGDGILNVSDPDDDNDGVPDLDDPCPLDGSDACDDTTSVVSLRVSGAMPLTSIGETIQLTATAHLLDGSSQAVASGFVHWVSSDPAVATVTDGTVTAVGPGNARVVATYEGQKAVAAVSVHISMRATGTVRVIYAAPTDREFRSDYRDAIQHAIVDLQSWFRRQTGGLTFAIYETTPEQCQLSEASDFYRLNAWQKVLDGVQRCAPVEGGTSAFTWVVYADVDMVRDAPSPLRRGGPGLAMLPHGDMEGLIGNRLLYYGVCGAGPWPGPVTLWRGVLGHELGHALRLTEPPGCEERLPTCDREELMHLGATVYPHTYLRPDNKEVLLRSPFVGRDPAHRPLTDDAAQAVTIGGTLTDPDGNVVEGIRISALADAFWGWGQSETDGTYEIRLPEDSAGSTVLSVHSGGIADCGWLGYQHAGGLTTLREQAIRIELDDTGPTDVGITLPAVPGEICQGQRTISGTVLGPEGEPARVWVNAFDRWSSTGDDGLFEIRLPDNSEESGRTSALLVYAQECRHFGFYGPGSFTTRPDEATQFEFGAVDVAGIEIRLPATPEELCGRQITIAGTVVGPDGHAVEGIGLEAEPFARRGTSAADGAFEIRLLEGSVGMVVLAVRADCGRVGYYGPDGFTRSRDDATRIDVGEGNVTGIEIRLSTEPDELCGQ